MRSALVLSDSARPMLFIALLLGIVFAPALAHTEPGERAGTASAFRAKMEKWVTTKQIFSAERAEWIVDKDTLEATQRLLRNERDDLREQIRAFEEAGADVSEERRQLLVERVDYQRSAEALALEIRRLEEQVLALAPRLPEPLRDKLDLLLVQIPENPENVQTPLGQRLMNVLGVLAQAEKWNSTATLVGESREIGATGKRIAVRTLYWGLAQAIYVDTQGEVAGIGRPSSRGWTFEDDPALAEEAGLLLDIYEGNVDTVAFVPVPVDVP